MRTFVVLLGLSACAATLLLGCGRSAAPASVADVTQRRAVEAPPPAAAGPVKPDPRVGAIFLGGGDLHTCTGGVLHSARGDLVLTAAHCLVKGAATSFVPGFADHAAPGDVWTVDAVYLDPRWVAAQDPLADYAIVRVSRAAGGTVETQAGSALSLGMAPTPGSRVNVTGYPVGVGGTPVGCQARTGITAGGYPSLPCAGLVDGTSGAPWISGSTVTGLVGGLEAGGCRDNESYSAPFDEHTAALLARAEAGGAGDDAPNALDDPC